MEFNCSLKRKGKLVNGKRWDEVMDVMNHTQRCYRHLRLDVRLCLENDLNSFWECFHPKVTENIHSLEVSVTQLQTTEFFALLVDTISQMSNLRSLSIPECHICYNRIIVLRSSCVQHLWVGRSSDIRIDMPELNSFEGPSCVLGQPKDTDQPLVLAKLKHVKLKEYLIDPWCRRIFHIDPFRFAGFEVEQNLFIQICTICTALKELHFENKAWITDPATVRLLSKLTNLRRLTFESLHMQRDFWYGFDFDFDISELNQLEELDLRFIVFDAERKFRLPKSIKRLSVSISESCNEHNIIQSITGSLTQLQKLRLVYGACGKWNVIDDITVSKRTLQSLQLFEHLKVLEFANAQFSESAFLDMHDSIQRLHLLRFVNCKLDNHCLMELEEMYPNLKIEFPDEGPFIPESVYSCLELDNMRREKCTLVKFPNKCH